MPVILTGMSITTADDRVTSYAPVVATTSFAADFPVFDLADISVFVDGIQRYDFIVTGTFNEGISSNATAVFSPGITGAVDVVGSRKAHRGNRFVNGSALPISAQNLALDTLEAEMQESARDLTRAHKAPYGQPGGVFTAADIGSAQSNAATATAAAAAAAASAAAAATFDPTNYYTKLGAAKAALADTDLLGLHDGAFKTFTLANLISSIFKTTRKIASAAFQDDVTFYSAAGLTKGFKFLASGITAGATRVITVPDADVDLGKFGIKHSTLVVNPNTAAVTFTGIPAGVKRITAHAPSFPMSAAAVPVIRLGSGGAVVSTGYDTVANGSNAATIATATDTTGLIAVHAGVTSITGLTAVFERMSPSSNAWEYRSQGKYNGLGQGWSSGTITLAGEPDRLQFTTTGGTALLTGTMNISWEF